MPIEQNGVKVKRLYKQEDGTPELVWGQPSISSQSFCFAPGYNPIGTPCSVEGDKMVIAGADIGMTPGTCYDLTCYASQTTPTVNTEIKLLQDNVGNIIHKRSNITYVTENNTLISSEIKTWGVEELNPPTPPTKEYHEFVHWESDVEGIIGTNTLAPITDAVYKPVYEVSFPGEFMTTQMVDTQPVNYGWGNLPTTNGEVVLMTEGFGGSYAMDPASGVLNSNYSQYGGQVTAKFGVDVHLEIEFTMGVGPFPQMLYEDDVPAGTEVRLVGSNQDQFFSIYVEGPQGNFSTYWQYEGIIEVRVTKL